MERSLFVRQSALSEIESIIIQSKSIYMNFFWRIGNGFIALSPNEERNVKHYRHYRPYRHSRPMGIESGKRVR